MPKLMECSRHMKTEKRLLDLADQIIYFQTRTHLGVNRSAITIIITAEQHVFLGKQGHMVTFISGDVCQAASAG